MQHPLIELKKLLAPKGRETSGQVVKVESTKVHVATSTGVKVAERTDATNYRVGDRAVLRGGEVFGRYRNESDILVFFI